ncbi:MAG: hypothetical protein COB02_00870 [Candidatus Cloacimonadota bacterium]|nr:MAG: hypothetical protein COB02_00870 [Candidatus Cloacimonadota bacterium]
MKKSILLMLCGGFSSSLSVSYAASNAQGQAAAYQKIGIDARILGMGGAGVAVTGDTNSTYWNPAGLSRLKRPEAAAMHTSLTLDRNYNYFSYSVPKKGGLTFGFAYHRFSVDGIPETRIYDGTRGMLAIDVDGNGRFDDPVLTQDGANPAANPNRATDSVKVFSYFEDAETSYSLSAAKDLNKKLSLGATLKFLEQTLFTEKANGTGLDLGLQYRHSSRVTFGLAFKDLFESLKWSTGRKDDVPVTTTIGGAFKLKSGALVSVDAVKREHEKFGMRFGAEKWFMNKYGLRVGNKEGEFTVGASAIVKEWTFDYAYNDEDLGSVQRISLKRSF